VGRHTGTDGYLRAACKGEGMPSRLCGWDYATPRTYFVTFCTHERRDVLGAVQRESVVLSAIGEVVVGSLNAANLAGTRLDAHIVMPDHVHLLLDTGSNGMKAEHLAACVGRVKAVATRRVHDLALLPSSRPLWQRGFFDRVVRDASERDAIRAYIATNPLRWTLKHL
jgi:putative transposase